MKKLVFVCIASTLLLFGAFADDEGETALQRMETALENFSAALESGSQKQTDKARVAVEKAESKLNELSESLSLKQKAKKADLAAQRSALFLEEKAQKAKDSKAAKKIKQIGTKTGEKIEKGIKKITPDE